MNQIRSIRPMSDADALRLADRDVVAELARQIMAIEGQQLPAARPVARRRRQPLAPLVAGVVAAAAAVALVAAGVVVLHRRAMPPVAGHPAGGHSLGIPDSAAQLVDYATRTAAAGPAFHPRPHQWIYTDVLRATSSAGAGGYLFGPPDGRLTQKIWTRVDFQEYAYYRNGRLVIAASNLPRSARTGRAVEPVPFGWPSVSYAYLNSLPASPVRLLAVIKANLRAEPDPIGAEGRGDVGIFNAVQDLLRGAVLPPRLLAALYGVLALDPAVHFERSVTDLAGRTGVGFSTVQEGYLEDEIVINPRTYAYMGYLDVAIKAHSSAGLDPTEHFHPGQVLGWQALLASGIVDRPGQTR